MKDLTVADLDEVLRAADPLWDLAAPDRGGLTFMQIKQVHSATSAMMRTGFAVVFDWQEEFRDRKQDLRSLAVLQDADLPELRRIMTAHLRMDRFIEGHMNGLLASGYWLKALHRLGQLRDAMAREAQNGQD